MTRNYTLFYGVLMNSISKIIEALKEYTNGNKIVSHSLSIDCGIGDIIGFGMARKMHNGKNTIILTIELVDEKKQAEFFRQLVNSRGW